MHSLFSLVLVGLNYFFCWVTRDHETHTPRPWGVSQGLPPPELQLLCVGLRGRNGGAGGRRRPVASERTRVGRGSAGSLVRQSQGTVSSLVLLSRAIKVVDGTRTTGPVFRTPDVLHTMPKVRSFCQRQNDRTTSLLSSSCRGL